MTYLLNLQKRRQQQQRALRKELRKEALHLIKLLLNSGFSCKRIYLFGSIVQNKPLARWSDIDLAIEGLEESLFLKAYACILKNSKYPIDLKPYEALDETFKAKIKSKGEVLYEKR